MTKKSRRLPTLQRMNLLLLLTTIVQGSRAFSNGSVTATTPESRTSNLCRPSSVVALARRPRDSNWEDEFSSSRSNAEITDYLPPWREHEAPQKKRDPLDNGPNMPKSGTNENVNDRNMNRAIQQGFKQKFQFQSTDEFKRPHGQPDYFSGSEATSSKSQPFQPFSAITPHQTAPAGITPAFTKVTSRQMPSSSQTSVRRPRSSSDLSLLATRVGITVLSTLSTWFLHIHNGHSPVLASSAATLLISTCLDKRLGQAAFCGSFAGMSGAHLAPSVSSAVLLSALTSLSYEVLIHAKNLSLGIGGRLGATAFVATSALARYRGVASVGRKVRRAIWKTGGTGFPLSPIVTTMMACHAVGAVATIFLREASDESGAADPVRASAVVGLLGALFVKDPTSVLALYGGSFVGMSLPSRLMYGSAPGNARSGSPTPLALTAAFAGAGAIAGLIHGITIHRGYWNGGWGGKAGLCAFAGCWIYRGLASAMDAVKSKAR
ncbi:hypothetical protein ACHAXS_007436 [Conticribra weissflogii]